MHFYAEKKISKDTWVPVTDLMWDTVRNENPYEKRVLKEIAVNQDYTLYYNFLDEIFPANGLPENVSQEIQDAWQTEPSFQS